MAASVLERLERLLPAATTWHLYGLTESGPSGTTLQPRDAMRKHGSCGQATAECEIRIVDAEWDELPPGAEGEVAILTPSRMVGYFENPEATARTIGPGGWLRTGDIGRMDDEGFLYILDRKNDLIIRGGFNVYPAEVEAALMSHPAVAEVAVVGAPHPVLGQSVSAFVVAHPDAELDADALRAHCAELIADYKRPRDVHFVDSLPRNAMGKVLRRQLAA
jgi:acyl-CoA synthetase (AMP-forming)/AMP-acid ligase II